MRPHRVSAVRPLALLVACALAAPSHAKQPIFPEFAPPESYGRVVLDTFTTRAGVPPVVFEHWRHRAMFACRLCHVDVGFAMQARATQISAATNRSNLHCGACHNGRVVHGGKPIFRSCAEGVDVASEPCARCHTTRGEAELRDDYLAFARTLPLTRGGMIDWGAAQSRGLVQPVDTLAGVSMPRKALQMDRDVDIAAKETWLGNALFSHARHAVWNGCEVCHPEIFPRTRRGATPYDMADIRAGRYCGACHNKVAFPLAYCQKCHIRSAP